MLGEIGYDHRFCDGSNVPPTHGGGRERKSSEKMLELHRTTQERAARLSQQKADTAHNVALRLSKEDIEMGTLGKGSNHDHLCSEQLAARAAERIPTPAQYADLDQKQNRCSTCNQPGHNTSSCHNMTIFSLLNKYIRQRGSKIFEDAVVLTPEIQAELSHDIFNTGLQVADIDAGRDATIYPDGFEAGTFNGDIDPDVDLTIDEAHPVPATKKAKIPIDPDVDLTIDEAHQVRATNKAKIPSASGRGRRQTVHASGIGGSEDPDDPFRPLGKKGKGKKGKGKGKGNGDGKPSYSRKAQGHNDSSGDDDDDDDDDNKLLAAAAAAIAGRASASSRASSQRHGAGSSTAGRSADVMHLSDSESSSDKSTKK